MTICQDYSTTYRKIPVCPQFPSLLDRALSLCQKLEECGHDLLVRVLLQIVARIREPKHLGIWEVGDP